MKNYGKLNIYLSVVIVFLAGCAASSSISGPAGYSPSDYIAIEDFCKNHNFKYSFDTIDDMVRIYSDDKEVRLLLGSHIAYLNANIINLGKVPFYSTGRIFLPRELNARIFEDKTTFFRPVYNIKTIVIDSGHGGKDPGAVSSSGFYEKTINLKVAKFLKTDLEKRGFKVILTREHDVYLTLEERIAVAKKYDADLFISMHANSNRSRQVSGLEVYYLSPSRLDSQSRAVKLARTDTVWFKKSVPFDAKTILWDMLLVKNYSLSVEFAHDLYFMFKKLGFKIKPPKQAPFYVLRYAYVPAVLVEMGYLSNRYEEKILKKTYYQKQIAETIASSVVSLNKKYTCVAHNE